MPDFLNHLKTEANLGRTENGAATLISTLDACVDLFAAIGALRNESDEEIISRFRLAFAQNPDLAMKILFFARDVRGGLGERRVFRVIARYLADHEPAALRRSIALIPEYGRFDDLLALMGTACEGDALALIRRQLRQDLASTGDVSLLAKWLPSINASSAETVRLGRRIARALGMTDAAYRRTLVQLRARIRIIENNLRQKDYTFDYAAQPSRAMLRYRAAFLRNDRERYQHFLSEVAQGRATLHTGTLYPYDVVAPLMNPWEIPELSEGERQALDATWNALEDFTDGANALVVADGSGSMYACGGHPTPAAVAMSLAVYFAGRSAGAFRNHFITFSERPQLVEIRGRDIVEKLACCMAHNEPANTNLQRVFKLILRTAVKHHAPQEQLPRRIYIISDMEFDACAEDADMTNFEYARALFARHGYQLPEVVFWNVASRHRNQPVTHNEQGVALVSGCSPRIFSMVTAADLTPAAVMMEILSSERYAAIVA